MRLPTSSGPEVRPRGPARGARRAGIVLAAGALLFAAVRGQQSAPPAPAPGVPAEVSSQYVINAHLFLLGDIGEGGTMTIESSLQGNNGRLEKRLRLAGNTNAAQAQKNRDYRGEFSILKLYPLKPDGSVDEAAVVAGRDFESSSSGYLKLNKKTQSERIVYYPDHAVSTREDGTEKRIEGSYGCVIAPLEYLMEHELAAGQTFEVPFLLNGVPRIFKCEVSGPETMTDFKTKAYRVDIWAVDKVGGADKAPKDVWRKKGNVRVYFCKDGPLRNRMLRMKIKFRWYLWLYFDLKS
jgi:hypothetical protein